MTPAAWILPFATSPVVIDGRLDDAAWADALAVPAFTVFLPHKGDPDEEVQAWMTQDDRAFYVAFRVRTTRKLDDAILPRDDSQYQEWVSLSLDTFGDGKRAFTFRVAPRGNQADGIFVEGADFWNLDTSWDEVWDSAGRLTDDGYEIELAIPFRSLRYAPGEAQEWGVLLTHSIPMPWTLTSAPPLDRDQVSILGQAARLSLKAPPPRGVRLELNPTLTGGWDQADGGFRLDPGLGVRLGVSSALTVDLAANPDFSQIEADAGRVTANVKYPLAYEEKRPFFLEGADFFDTPLDVLYTRSVVDPLGGAKLSGRVGPVALGLWSTWDEAPAPSTIFVDYASLEPLPSWSPTDTEGATALGDVARVRWDSDHASVGALYSGKTLFRAEGAPLDNQVAGLDARVQLGDHVVVTGQALGAHTTFAEGEAADAPAWRLVGAWNTDTWSAAAEHRWIASGFRAENGFLTEVGRMTNGARVTRMWHPSDSLLRSLDVSVAGEVVTNPEGAVTNAVGVVRGNALIGDTVFTQAELPVIHEVFATKTFDRWSFDGLVSVSPSPAWALVLAWDVGPVPHYAAATVEDVWLGWGWQAEPTFAISAFDRLSSVWTLTAATFAPGPWDAPLYTTFIPRWEATLNLSRPLALRVIEEWSVGEDTLDSSVLLAWERSPGTAAWVGWSSTVDTQGEQLASNELFAKVSVLWRI